MALDDCCVLPPLDCLDWGWDWDSTELLHTHHTLGGAAAGAGGAAAAVQAEPPTFFFPATRKCSAQLRDTHAYMAC